MSRLTEADVETIRTMRASGASISAIAAATKRSKSAILETLHRLGIQHPHSPLGTGRTAWTADMIAALHADWDAGVSSDHIGAKLGVTRSAVVGKAHDLKLRLRSTTRITNNGSPAFIERFTASCADLSLTWAMIGERFGVLDRTAQRWHEAMGLPARSSIYARVGGYTRPRRTAPVVLDTIFGGSPDAMEKPPTRKPIAPQSDGSADPVATGVAASPPYPTIAGRSEPCCFVISDGRPWRYCDAPSPLGQPWCPQHRAVVYVRRPAAEYVGA